MIMHEAKSPASTNAKTLRRQSLTGIVPPERSRRSSLGGVSTDSCKSYHDKILIIIITCIALYNLKFVFNADVNENRNAKTPPPQIRASATKLTKRWV